MNRLKGKVALITGAAQGMGESHARVFVEEGAKVIVADLAQEAGERLAKELGENAAFMRLDVSDPASWAQVIKDAKAKFGTVTVLVNNAGVSGPPVPTADLSDADYLKTVAVDQHGVFYGMRAAIPGMLEAGGGSIINISSVAGFVHQSPNAAYTAAKFAVRGLTKAAAIEYAERKIRVNSVHPGAIWTPMLQGQDKAALDAFSATIPMKRFGELREVSNLVLFLASDESSYITGAEHLVEGGALSS